MSVFVRNLLTEQRKRLVGSLMTYLEQNVFQYLSPAEQADLRKKVLASSSAYHDVCLDMLKASISEDTLLNEEALRVIAQFNRNARG